MSFRELVKEYKSSYHSLADEAKVDLAVQVERAMIADGVSRAELARRLNCNRSYVTKVLQGDVNMTIESMAKLAHALGRRLDIHIAEENVRWWKVVDGGKAKMSVSPFASIWQQEAAKKAA